MPPFLRSRAAQAAMVVLAVLIAAPACGGGSKAATPRKVARLPATLVPGDLLGLTVALEKTQTQTEGVKRPYIDAVGLYSLRKGPLLEATLEVGRFTKESDYKSRGFQGTVVSQIGSTEPKEFRMGSQPVWLTTGRRQSLAIWFKERYFFILTARDDYPTPRALLRRSLEIKP